MRTVYKYPLSQVHESELEIPAGAKFVHFDFQTGSPIVWLELETTEKRIAKRTFRIIGTGHPIPVGYDWRGTTLSDPGFVWHLYERFV